MRIRPPISLLILLLICFSWPAKAQFPAQDEPIEGLLIPNSSEQISIQTQKLYLEGLLAINNTSLEEGLTLLLQAEELDPNQSGIKHAIADTYFQLNDYDNALFYAENSLTKEPMNPWYRTQLAHILYAKGYYQAAVNELELVLSQHTYHWTALTFLVEIHRSMGFLVEANTVIRERILAPLQRAANQHSRTTSQPNELPILPFSQGHKNWFRLLYSNFEVLGMPDSMKTVANEMRYLFPYDENISALASKDEKKSESDGAEFTQVALVDGATDTASPNKTSLDKPESSLLLAQLQQGSSPASPEEAIEWLRLLKQQNANLTKRQNLALEWNELFPQQGEILSELARIQLGLENQNEALKWFEKAVRSPGKRTQKSEWYRQLGELQAEAGDLESAEGSFSYALRYDPKNAHGWASSAYFNARYRNNRAEADSNIKQALLINPENAAVIELKGDVHHIFGELEQALIWWKKALELDEPNQRIQQKLSGNHE